MGWPKIVEKARHSCYDQMAWVENGERHEGRVTVENLERALAAIGEDGRFTIYQARTGTAYGIPRWHAETYLANAKAGYL
jgi:hypothetical protein